MVVIKVIKIRIDNIANNYSQLMDLRRNVAAALIFGFVIGFTK